MTDQQDFRDMKFVVYIAGVMVALFAASLILMWLTCNRAHAHDAMHPEHEEWYRDLKQPDNPEMSCCGIYDAYWADEIHVRDGKAFATITDDRDDASLRGRHHVPMGTVIEVPNEKLKWDAGNPTGHAVIFLTVNNDVLCYVQNGGT